VPAGSTTDLPLSVPRSRDVRVGASSQIAVPIVWPETREGPAADSLEVASRSTVTTAVRRVLVAGVGYSNLRDLSVGPALVGRLRQRPWPAGVEVEDLSYGAIHVLHWLQEGPRLDALVLLGAAARGREPGSTHRYPWVAPPMTAEQVQERVAEAVTGVISLDGLLVVLGYFGALPPRVTIIEVEPRDDDWGPDFSDVVDRALDDVERLVEDEIERLLA